MVGEAEQDIARQAALEFGLEPGGRCGLEERGETPARFGRRREPRGEGEAFSQRCGH